MKSAEEPEGAQIGFLHDIFGVRVIARQPARQVVGGIKVRQDRVLKADQFMLALQSVVLLNSHPHRKDRSWVSFIPDSGKLIMENHYGNVKAH